MIVCLPVHSGVLDESEESIGIVSDNPRSSRYQVQGQDLEPPHATARSSKVLRFQYNSRLDSGRG